MDSKRLKALREGRGIQQKEMAEALGLTAKSMCQKENSSRNRFKADEMLVIAEKLGMTFSDFDAIFFENELSERLRKIK